VTLALVDEHPGSRAESSRAASAALAGRGRSDGASVFDTGAKNILGQQLDVVHSWLFRRGLEQFGLAANSWRSLSSVRMLRTASSIGPRCVT